MPDPIPPQPAPTRRHYTGWAVALFVIGGLIATVSGLCTGVIVIGTTTDSAAGGYASGIMGFALIVGGVPFLIGVGLILAARKWGRRGTAPNPPSGN